MASATSNHPVTLRRAITDPALLLATVFGSGLSPVAPGTIGSIAALPMAWWLMQFDFSVIGVVCVITMLVGVWACSRAGAVFGVYDHGSIVIDEVLGQWLAIWLSVWALGDAAQSVWLYLVAFFWFRVFDIIKPWPVSWFDQKVKGGFGVMMDDVAAGVMAAPLTLFCGIAIEITRT